jgi:Dual specificity phosphatase, catalytic domain
VAESVSQTVGNVMSYKRSTRLPLERYCKRMQDPRREDTHKAAYAPLAPETPAIAPGRIVYGDDWNGHRIVGETLIGGHDVDCPLVSHVLGNLYQGGCPDEPFARVDLALPDGFEFVVSLYPWGRYLLPTGCERSEFELHDSTSQDTSRIEEMVDVACDYVARGVTLVHCQAGLNRSGLIAGRVLMRDGMSADEAIRLLRRRSPAVLCNPTFEAYLRSFDAQ